MQLTMSGADWILLLGTMLVAFVISCFKGVFAYNYKMLGPDELPERTEIKQNFSLHRTVLPMWTKFWAIVIGATGPILLLLGIIAGVIEENDAFFVFTNPSIWGLGLTLLIFAPTTIWMGFWLVKRSRAATNYIENEYKYSFAVTKRGLFFPMEGNEDYFVAWKKFTYLDKMIRQGLTVQGVRKHMNSEFGFSENDQDHFIRVDRGERGGFLDDVELTKAVNYIIAFSPATARVDRTLVKDLRKKHGLPEPEEAEPEEAEPELS